MGGGSQKCKNNVRLAPGRGAGSPSMLGSVVALCSKRGDVKGRASAFGRRCCVGSRKVGGDQRGKGQKAKDRIRQPRAVIVQTKQKTPPKHVVSVRGPTG